MTEEIEEHMPMEHEIGRKTKNQFLEKNKAEEMKNIEKKKW